MNRPRSEEGLDDGGDEGLEQELARLLRQLRIMENDRNAYTESTRNIIRKQKAEIDILTKENQEITTNMSQAQSVSKHSQDNLNAEKLGQLLYASEEYKSLMDEEKKNISNLDAQIRTMENKICQQRKKMGGVHNCEARKLASNKEIRVLENRLDQAVINFNKQLAKNTHLREEIDHLRQEREVFENLYKKLARELRSCKENMRDVIHQATHAYEQRDEARNKMHALKDRSEKDKLHNEAEMKDLWRMIEHDEKLKAFMNIKDQERNEFLIAEAAKKKQKGSRAITKDLGAMVQEIMEMTKKNTTLYQQMYDSKYNPFSSRIKEKMIPAIQAVKEGASDGLDGDKITIQTYQSAFDRIKEATGEEDIDIIVQKFIKTEDQNFALFNYVNELNNEVELLTDDIGKVKDDIAKFSFEETKLENSRRDIVKEVETKVSAAQKQASDSSERLKAINKILDQLKRSVASMFKKLDCDPAPIREILGSGTGVTDNNVMMYLGLIEQRTNELTAMKHFLELKKLEPITVPPPKQGEAQPIGPTTPIRHASVHIIPPTTGEDFISLEMEEGDDDLRPFTREELRERVMRGIDRKMEIIQQTGAADSPTGSLKEMRKKSSGKA